MDVHFVVQVTPVPGHYRAQVLIKAYPYKPVVLGDGHVMLNQIITVNAIDAFPSSHTYILDLMAKISHTIADDIEEAGYTPIEDLMLVLRELK